MTDEIFITHGAISTKPNLLLREGQSNISTGKQETMVIAQRNKMSDTDHKNRDQWDRNFRDIMIGQPQYLVLPYSMLLQISFPALHFP